MERLPKFSLLLHRLSQGITGKGAVSYLTRTTRIKDCYHYMGRLGNKGPAITQAMPCGTGKGYAIEAMGD